MIRPPAAVNVAFPAPKTKRQKLSNTIEFKMSPLPKTQLPIRLICLDADDTLWGHESYFQASYRRFVDLLAPFAGASRSEERLVEIENRNLHLYGYGVKGFTLSMLETALEIMGDELTAATTRAILEIGRDLMRHPIDLLDGVREALGPLERRGSLVMVTKGDLFHQESNSPPRASATGSPASKS